MNFFSRLFRRSGTPATLTCPRCLGKGHVDKDDIIRLKQQGKWGTGRCAYCEGTGTVDKAMLSKVPVDASYLTTNLSEAERDAIVNNFQREGCPVSEHNRLWLENAFLILLDFFGEENTRQRRVVTPHLADFPVLYNRTEQSAYETMTIVAAQMDVSPESIRLNFYDDRVREISSGSLLGGPIYPGSREDDQQATGLYMGQTEDGKFEIWLNRSTLSEPECLVAVLAHEIAHIKLLGENRLEVNNEPLTDLTTVVFGLGIFNANDAFQTSKTFQYYSWKSNGYLSQPQWGYALALFAHLRGENSPSWIDHLTPNVKGDFLQGQRFILDNPDLVFQKKETL